MRKTIAIFLFFVFTAAQYQRYAGFAECRLVNYFSATGEKCDCEKLIQKMNASGEQPALPVTHNHQHTDESYYLSASLMPGSFTGNFYTPIFPPAPLLTDGIPSDIDHPPPMNDFFLSFI